MSLSRRELLYASALIPLSGALPAFAGKPIDPGPKAELLAKEVGTTFLARTADGQAHLLLLEDVTTFTCGGEPGGAKIVTEGFSAVFASKAEALEQDVYAFEHDRVASFTALMVPIVTRDGPQRHEVIFNRMARA